MSVVSAGDIRKEGWVLKESAVMRSYRKRWVVLTRECLYSFKRERAYVDPTEVPSPPRHLSRTRAWQAR